LAVSYQPCLALSRFAQALSRVHALLDFVGEGELPSRVLTARYRFVHALYHDVLYDS